MKQWELIRLRTENKLTQIKMSKILKVNVTTYNSKENGKIPFNANEMFIIGNYFNKSLEDIFLPNDSIFSGTIKEKIHSK